MGGGEQDEDRISRSGCTIGAHREAGVDSQQGPVLACVSLVAKVGPAVLAALELGRDPSQDL